MVLGCGTVLPLLALARGITKNGNRQADPLVYRGHEPFHQNTTKSSDIRQMEVKKEIKVSQKGYLEPLEVHKLLNLSSAPKDSGNNTIMVYNETSSILNDLLWVPNLSLPTMYNKTGTLQEGTYMAEIYTGGIFTNFIIHKDLRKCFCMDVTHMKLSDL